PPARPPALPLGNERSRKPRTMAFNPVDPGLFAVCSADLSVDLWRYGRNKQELEKV
ncbi:unnamed protein product, partial [Ectocarpus sp. 8 AP-2014]